jgi:flagellum-specific ATP synthase
MNQSFWDMSKYRDLLRGLKLNTIEGKISRVTGMMIEAIGLECSIGDVCEIHIGGENGTVLAEVVGIADKVTYLMPYCEVDGIGYGCPVTTRGEKLTIKVSDELTGRTINALGIPIDDRPPIAGGVPVSIGGSPGNPLDRPPISEIMEIGVKAIDGLLTIGKGQRIGIFAGSGVGKSTLMGMIARNVRADINVIALVGERGREVVEFIERDLGPEGKKRSVLVVATSDQPALMRLKCAQTATAIAEYHQRQGKDVLLMMDSLTRFAMAQRDIGLNSGEAPVARGYTPSIYSALPKLLERAGNFKKGSITGIYTVLVEGDDTNEPISDTVRGIIDGHIILSRKLASKNHYPAIDVLNSVSRLMTGLVSPEHREAANKMRKMLAILQDNEDLISIGAYEPGNSPELDNAVAHRESMDEFLTQSIESSFSFEEALQLLIETVK